MYECECKKVTVRFPGPQGPTAGIYRQPNTNYNKGECVYLGKEPLNIFLECTATGVTSTDDIVSLPDNKETDDTFIDGTVTWIIRKIVTSNFNGSLKITGDIEANNANIKNKTTTGSLEVKNDAEIENNLQINGKLVVPNVYVTEKLLIGNYDPSKPEQPDLSNFLTPDDLQKLQDQIIAPEQNLYVDQKNGDDDNDGTSEKTAVRTLGKAISLIRQDIPTLTIHLKTYIEENDKVYNTFHLDEPINFTNTYQSPYRAIRVSKQFTISATWDNYVSDNVVATIVAPYGKVSTGDKASDGSLLYAWGNILFIAPKCSMKFVATKFSFPEDLKTDDKYTNTFIYQLVGSLEVQNIKKNTTEIPENCSFLNAYYGTTIDRVEFSLAGTINGNGMIINARSGKLFKTDPKTTDGGETKNNMVVSGLITKYIKDGGTSITGNLLGSTKGLYDNTEAIYIKGFN